MELYGSKKIIEEGYNQEEINSFILQALINSSKEEVIECIEGLLDEITISHANNIDEEERYNTNKFYFFITFYKEYSYLFSHSEEVLEYIKKLEYKLEERRLRQESIDRSLKRYAKI